MQIQLFPVALQIVCHWQSELMPMPMVLPPLTVDMHLYGGSTVSWWLGGTVVGQWLHEGLSATCRVPEAATQEMRLH